MAMRLATEYVKTRMQLTEEQFAEFIQMFVNHQASLQVKVLENGNHEVVLQDDAGQDVILSFERKWNYYVLQGSCRITNMNLVNLMRKAVSSFKGSAIVHRIYSSYTMVYQYERGTVVKITEMRDTGQKVIYEYRDTAGELQQLFQKDAVEQEIGMIQEQIDGLLDLRNSMTETEIRRHIDGRLKALTHRLFVLEA
ncbi:non-ribosomal peptide synthetase module [Paenibacillus hamazuiensis]|uniref:non-ribosomal peptide synthetase module n=1 Tax=Paenibacillus hamazuiensis TaxID=2936508 RepID=UPI00200E138A|nr:non-ribosomal peptide synthetase module [Paenibacillus hamazuiensis]